jgi:hypothetical protein
MKKEGRFFLISLVSVVLIGALIGCGGGEDGKGEAEDSASVSLGTYEGEWAMTPQMKPLVSLVLEEGNHYEFYISIMGLAEEGSFSLKSDGAMVFTPEEGEKTEGTYEEGMVTASFPLGEEREELSFLQVGSPDDVYKNFLGDYLTTAMGDTDVLLELKKKKQYVNTLSGETGSFKIQDGEITLTPESSEAEAVSGTIDLRSKTITITMSLAPGTPASEYTFRPLSDEDVYTYKGTAEKGMGGSTEVTLLMKRGGRFELVTSKPRGTGNYTIKEEDGTFALELEYTDPAERPDGGAFVMTGTTAGKDVGAAGNVVTLDTVEYIVVMQDDPSVMDLGTVKFTLQEE